MKITAVVPLQLDWLLGRNPVSKMAVLLTELAFGSDLVSKTPDLLTEWVFEIDLVSKTAVLLTERCRSVATVLLARGGSNASAGIMRE